jgi:hypothetical protein
MKIHKMIISVFYVLKPIMPRPLQIWLRRIIVRAKRKKHADKWPILETAAKKPQGWRGWPDSKNFAFILTHDVDTARGQERCYRLMEIEEKIGFRSSFNFVPERYTVSSDLREHLIKHGFEVGVHGLNHDGKLFRSRKIFNERANKINHYLQAWDAAGFRSPAMHHNLEWIHDLDIRYDMSTFDVDPFEPQSDGVHTIFPFQVTTGLNGAGYVELPYTLPQDFTLFILMQEKDVSIWQQKLDWIVLHGGMALLNTHPDYMRFSTDKMEEEVYSVDFYKEFLEYVRRRYKGLYWHVRPCEMAAYISKQPIPYVTTG